MRRMFPWAATAVAVVLFLASPCFARPTYADRIPNGSGNCGVCHESAAGGDARRNFGRNFEFGQDNNAGGPNDGDHNDSADHRWTRWLCELDSDSDGWTNGEELGDPFCTQANEAGSTIARTVTAPGAFQTMPWDARAAQVPDINFCNTQGYQPCGPNSRCTSPVGDGVPNYTCSCSPGFRGGGGRRPGRPADACNDIPECSEAGAPTCGGRGSCVNLVPGWDCACDTNYVAVGTWMNGSRTCINGCEQASVDCVGPATCEPIAVPPNFRCNCPNGGVGYTGNGRPGSECRNVDECQASDVCGIEAGRASACTDQTPHVDGGRLYTCTCTAGYRFNGTTCEDIDECADDPARCGPGRCDDSRPPNPPNSWTCSCNAGFETTGGSQPSCVDIDECRDPALHRCAADAFCTNSIGSWTCTCNRGFEGDGFSCVDIDECARGLDECDVNASCTNLHGTHRCTCNAFWEGSGVTCEDIDECAAGAHPCTSAEVCVNQVGAAPACTCAPGYSRPSPTAPCQTICGDGLRGRGEACDDGNAVDDDGCTSACAIEIGYVCNGPPFGTSTCSENCGDGLIDPGEECDDGDARNSDDQANACRTDCRRAWCGDGVTDRAEECDRGDANSNVARDGCRTDCHAAFCGDGVIDSGEICDRGGGVAGASVAGACTTACAADGGVDPSDPPVLTGGGACHVAPSGGSPWWIATALALAVGWRRRRRR